MPLLCVYLPIWPIDRLRRRLNEHDKQADPANTTPHSTPPSLLLIHTRASIQYIAACCHTAQRSGVRPGMTLAQARAMIGSDRMHCEDFDPAAERNAMLRFAHWAALRYSPIVSVDPCTLNNKNSAEEPIPDGLVMDITGCEQLFLNKKSILKKGTSALRAEMNDPDTLPARHMPDRIRGQHQLAQSLLNTLSRAGFESRIGIGPTIGSAWAAARFGPQQISTLSSRTLREQLSVMPVRALRIDGEIEQALVELGLETIGHLLDLPRASLPARFGPLLLRRIDQALGSAIETIEPVRPAPPLRLERIFDGPTPQIEAIETCTQELLYELSRELLHRESGVRLLETVYQRIGHNGRGTEPLTQRITLSRPSRNPRHLWILLRPRIEKMHLGYGIESITLTALRTARLRHQQNEYIDQHHQTSRPEQGELIDTLANRLGPDRVLRAEPVESHIPERASRFIPVLNGPSRSSTAPTSAPAPSSRPTILFDHPEPVEALALQPDRPPTLLRWRGQECRITAALGPERIAGEWWLARRSAAGDAWERDYFRLCDDAGRWLWVYRETPLFPMHDLPEEPVPMRWFIHGIWA